MDSHTQEALNSTPDSNTAADSTAANFQSRISTSNSLQRLRLTASSAHNLNIHHSGTLPPPFLQDREPFSRFTLLLRRVLLPAQTLPYSTVTRPVPHPRPWSTLCIKWVVTTYCLLSVVIFSISIYKHVRSDRYRTKPGHGISLNSSKPTRFVWVMWRTIVPLQADCGRAPAHQRSRVSRLGNVCQGYLRFSHYMFLSPF